VRPLPRIIIFFCVEYQWITIAWAADARTERPYLAGDFVVVLMRNEAREAATPRRGYCVERTFGLTLSALLEMMVWVRKIFCTFVDNLISTV
jgi:hypothetical protein